jgi:hypothetical protein
MPRRSHGELTIQHHCIIEITCQHVLLHCFSVRSLAALDQDQALLLGEIIAIQHLRTRMYIQPVHWKKGKEIPY